MGVLYSCPLAECNDVESAFESVIVKSISFGVDDKACYGRKASVGYEGPLPGNTNLPFSIRSVENICRWALSPPTNRIQLKARTPLRFVSFSSRDCEPSILNSRGSGETAVERSVSVTASEFERMNSPDPSNKEKDASVSNGLETCQSPREEILSILDPNNPRHEAAIKLQKVYKSFRTRRKLADCAVLVEQSWWKLLDFAELKHSSISFFDIEKHESAMSRWSRARKRAAKVGKGLSKNGKAQKLALQHWLEAIDPRHRYGHNLRFYYVQWLHSKSREPFFYWLDIGEGKEVNLERSPRSILQQQCIKYLGPIERKAYEVVVEDGKFIYKRSGELLDTTEDAKWIFVLSTSKALYVGKKKKGRFQHSSFLAGGVTIAAGRIIVESGALKAVWPYSGHYRPTEENFRDFLSFLRENNVDLTDVKTSPTDKDEISVSGHGGSKHVRNHSSEEDLDQAVSEMIGHDIGIYHVAEEETNLTAATIHHMSQRLRNFGSTLQRLELPSRDDELVESNPIDGLDADNVAMEASADGYMSEESEGNGVDSIVPQEAILHRISSKKISKSFQLGKQLSCKWTTGAGPRIGCVRDYPTELQFRALEQVNLSPRRT